MLLQGGTTTVILLAITAISFNECEAITVTEVIAPLVIRAGGSADLECRWILRPDEQLYSIKWYHGLHEIYRYTPSKADGPVRVFQNKFLRVEPSQSERGKVRVTNISLQAEGLFRCEVSGEAPAFFTDYGTINITIVALPDGGPHIVGVRPRYQLGDWVDLTCISSESKPAAAITIYINGYIPSPEWLVPQRIVATSEGKWATSQRVSFALNEGVLGTDGSALVECEAEIPKVHKETTRVMILAKGPYLASIREPFGGSDSLKESDSTLLSLSILWIYVYKML